MQPDDATLVIRTLQGDSDAFGQLYDRYARLVRAICYDTTGRLERAQDLAQEVFLRAYARLSKLRSPERFGPWLVTMTRNVCREYRRSRARDRHVLVGLAPEEPDQPARDRTDARLDRLRDAIDKLPEKQKMALRVYYLQGEDVAQATRLLEMSRSSFYRLLDRAKKNLENRLLRDEQAYP